MPLAQLADPWQKMPVGTAGEEPHHEAEDSVGEDDSAPLTDVKREDRILQLLFHYHRNDRGKSLDHVFVGGVTTNRDDRKAGSS